MQKIKRGDKVVLLAGKDKGRQGTILKVINRQSKKGLRNPSLRVVVEGLNMVKKHVKANPQEEKPGGIIEKEAAIDISNVAILNTGTDKADRVGIKTLDDGRKVRFFKSDGEVIDV
jgi:large subunit ribosomal protein L24